MRTPLLIFFCLLASVCVAQFQVGHQSVSFTDASRADRQITCELYYPSTTGGDGAAVAGGAFPFVVFGHGFVMDYTAYQNITDALVQEGFIVIYVETESGFAPVHSEFGLDLAYVADYFFEQNTASSWGLESHVIDRCAIMGHSMGGGSTWLAASTSESVDCIAGLAPAETNPSAVAAAANVTVPALVLSGSSDAVTAPADNHTPIFDATSSACKYFVNIIEGSHCGFANSGSLCDLAPSELFFTGLSREEQQAITHELLLAWFDVYLRDNAASNEVLQLYDDMQSNTETTIACVVSVEDNNGNLASVYPNPGSNELVVEWSYANRSRNFVLCTMDGRRVMEGKALPGQKITIIATEALASGIYLLALPDAKPIRWVKQ